MIAVFTRSISDYKNFKFFPKENFVRIRRIDDLVGRKFDGALTYIGFWENKEVEEAYYYLKERQPELFK